MKEILSRFDTFPKLLLRNAERFGDGKVAMREKEFGIWQAFSWAQYHEHVKYFSLGLISLGLARGDKVAIIGDNRPEWVWAEIAAQAAGAVPLGLYQDSTLKEVAYIIEHSDASFVVAEDQEQVDKILEILEQVPKVRYVVYTDPRGMRGYKAPQLLDFRDVEQLGRDLDEAEPELYGRNVAASSGDDLAFLCYTSGTTGFPKGAMLTFRNLLTMAANLMTVDPKSEADEFVSFLPLAWIGEQMMCLSSALLAGFAVNFPERPETVQENIREIGPTIMFSPPRIWENMTSTVQVKILDASWLKRSIYGWAMATGYAYADTVFGKRRPHALLRLKYRLAYLLLFRALRDRLGLLRIRTASTGGAALGPDVFRFFNVIGVNLKQIYGQTEISGISCIHRDGDVHFDSVGLPIPETEIRIAEDGEILSRSPSIFVGYYKSPEETEGSLREGWLHSGDAGYFNDDGHLVVIDRVKDVMRLTDGTIFSPQFIENKLKFSPYIKECVCLGNERDFLAAMICIDYANVGKWAESRRISYTTYADLAEKPAVQDLIGEEVTKVNATLPRTTQLRRFLLLYKELDADDDELTRTRKVRRSFVGERYRDVIASVYDGADAIPVDAVIQYQDGKTSRVRTTLAVRNL